MAGLAAFTGTATLEGLYRDVVLDSLRFVDFGKTWPVFGSEVGVFLVAVLGLSLVLRVRGLAILGHPVHGVLLLPTLTSVSALFLPRTPAVYQHAWLPLLPVAAIYAGLALATLAEWARQDPTPLAQRARPGGDRGGGGRARHGRPSSSPFGIRTRRTSG